MGVYGMLFDIEESKDIFCIVGYFIMGVEDLYLSMEAMEG